MRYIIGGILIAFGVLLLLSNTDIITLDWGWNLVRTWWPILLILWGIWELVSGGFQFRLWPVILLLLGIGFQLSALNLWEWDFSVVWPVFIVIVGLAILLGRRRRRDNRQQRSGTIIETAAASATAADDTWRAVFTNIGERYPARDFRGGEVEVYFGNVALNLTDAELVDSLAQLEVHVTFGGLLLQVPAGWRVTYDGVITHFAEVQDHRTQTSSDVYSGELIIAGPVTFGHVEITD